MARTQLPDQHEISTIQITYFFDPLCGWCYGAGPAVERLLLLDRITVQFAPTGLFAGENARPMDTSFAAYAWQNDERIARLTGQVFSEAYRAHVLGGTGTKIDSAPATLGVVAVALSQPDREFDALRSLQRARYVDGRDNGALPAVADILSDAGFADAAQRILVPDAELLTAYRARIDVARREMARFSARGVPALVIEDARGSRLAPSNILFGDLETLTSQLQAA